MENVEKASQAMNEQASQRKDVRLKEIRNVTVQSMVAHHTAQNRVLIPVISKRPGGRVEDPCRRGTQPSVRGLQGHRGMARSLTKYVDPDSDKFVTAADWQGWRESKAAKESRRASKDKAMHDHQGKLCCYTRARVCD